MSLSFHSSLIEIEIVTQGKVNTLRLFLCFGFVSIRMVSNTKTVTRNRIALAVHEASNEKTTRLALQGYKATF